MTANKNPLLALAKQLDDANSAKEKLAIYDAMVRIIREGQKIYRLVEVVKDIVENRSVIKALEAPPTDDGIDPYAHLTQLVHQKN
jgi:hypothetical protein